MPRSRASGLAVACRPVTMTDIDRVVQHVLHDPLVSRVFLAFTVGLLLSCSAEFAAGQGAVQSTLRAPQPVHSASLGLQRRVTAPPR